MSDFITVMGNVGIPVTKEQAYSIFAQAVPHSIRDRVIVTSGDSKVRAKAQRVVDVAKKSAMTVERFNRLLVAKRTEFQHRHMAPIYKGSKDWTMLQEIAKQACEFSEVCGFDSIDEGCKIYLHLGLEKMKYNNVYSLNRFKTYNSAIYEAYDSLYMIEHDPAPKRTRRMHDCYVSLLAQYAGLTREFKDAEEYVCFVYARIEADKAKVTVEDWITAQFEELQRMVDAVPSPRQLFSENALKRYNSYMRQGKKVNSDEEVIVDWNAPKTDFEERYAKKMREKYSEE